jgi:hypothetical protein
MDVVIGGLLDLIDRVRAENFARDLIFSSASRGMVPISALHFADANLHVQPLLELVLLNQSAPILARCISKSW